MSHDPLYFAQVFGFFMEFVMFLFAVWGFFWALSKLVAPFVRTVLGGLRINF